MDKKETLERARFIFTTGKMIRDRILRIHAADAPAKCNREACLDLSLSQIYVTMVTRERGQLTVTELAEILGVSPPSASAMVERLVEKGILTREHSRADRRKVVVRVSPDAEKDMEQVEERILQSFVDLVEKIGPETSRKWCEALERVKEVVSQDDWRGTRMLQAEGTIE